jgi:phosphate transport system protein
MNERSKLTEDIGKLDALLAQMAVKAGEALHKALLALQAQDLDLAKSVKAGDSEIDALQVEIEDLAAVTLATQQPVASDLRILVAAFKVASDFERAADYAVHLAKATKKFMGEPKSRQLERLALMAEIGGRMMAKTSEAFMRRSPEMAGEAALLDDLIDKEHKATILESIELMRLRPEDAEKAAKLITTSGYLERLGDHMTNACEAVVFMTTGTRVDLNE